MVSIGRFRAVISRNVSRRLTSLIVVGQVLVFATYYYNKTHGNPVRIGMDDHGVWRFLSMREYLEKEVREMEEKFGESTATAAQLQELQMNRARLEHELKRLEGEDFVADRDIPIQESDLRL